MPEAERVTENPGTSDGEFLRAMSGRWPFRGIDRVVGCKRMHDLNMQLTQIESTGRRE